MTHFTTHFSFNVNPQANAHVRLISVFPATARGDGNGHERSPDDAHGGHADPHAARRAPTTHQPVQLNYTHLVI